ncbi:Ankyrin [Maricaulis maris MCS10]|uniref:Ankyrin n=1 Tax=Maricaulis maris (strain MCS10) TaxID=394221 RepID=Q0AS96_MARMM|nr:ankyrin repeat domain-containing protein [Maricaulis maris]ABI64841.1 Ankyrin [Maricaulis maris MCS10]
MRFIIVGLAMALAMPLALGAAAVAQIPPAISDAISDGDVEALTAALDAGADPDARAETGLQATPLMLAASNPDPGLTRALIAAGADIEIRDVMGDPAINWAAYYGHSAVVAELLSAGASRLQVGHGTAAEIAMRRGHQATLAITLRDEDGMGQQGRLETLLETAIVTGDVAMLTEIGQLTDLSGASDWAGRPLLHAAARSGQTGTAAILIAAGADIDAVDAIGFTALFEAARDGQDGMVEWLITAGADVDHVAAENGMALTAVHLAAIGGDVGIVSRLAAAGANLDRPGVSGATALYWAAFEGQREAVLALLAAGADPGIVPDGAPEFAAVAEMLDWPDVAARLSANAAD